MLKSYELMPSLLYTIKEYHGVRALMSPKIDNPAINHAFM